MNRYKLLALAAALTGVMGAASAETTLTVYTALEADQIKAYQAAFEKAHPDIKIQWVRDSTGIIAAKLLAEKGNPKADSSLRDTENVPFTYGIGPDDDRSPHPPHQRGPHAPAPARIREDPRDHPRTRVRTHRGTPRRPRRGVVGDRGERRHVEECIAADIGSTCVLAYEDGRTCHSQRTTSVKH